MIELIRKSKNNLNKQLFIGHKVVNIRKMTTKEAEMEGWNTNHSLAMVLEFDDGSLIYAGSDDEGNNVGCLFGIDAKGNTIYVGGNIQ